MSAAMGEAHATPSVAPRPRHWLVAPWFDVFLVANFAWPLLLLIQWQDGFEGRAGLQFWQVYFVTTPHRWITLGLVFLDRDRFRQRRAIFLGWLAAVVVLCTTVRWTTDGLTCLLTIDYIWNAWHFAAQHQGIYRIYGRLTDASAGWRVVAERWMLRLFLLYVTLRVAIATWSDATLDSVFAVTDFLVPAIPIALLLRDCFQIQRVALGRIVYLFSVSSLYLSLLWAVHTHQPRLILSLTTASALFHALEYLSIVSWTVRKRNVSPQAKRDWLTVLATQWVMTLSVFLLILGAGAWLMDQYWAEQWLFANVIAAFLHYAYDGLIWRYRPTQQTTLVTLPQGTT